MAVKIQVNFKLDLYIDESTSSPRPMNYVMRAHLAPAREWDFKVEQCAFKSNDVSKLNMNLEVQKKQKILKLKHEKEK